MRFIILAVGVCFLASAGGAGGQPASVGDNANILPIFVSDPPNSDDYLRGNLLGQRCNEPSIGISSINPDHMMVFCNDYRATFNFDDALVPSGKTTLMASLWDGVRTFFAWVTGTPAPERPAPRIIATAEAGIGGGVTYDGGITWHGFLVPGGPNDSTTASQAHPGKQLNLQGYSDPVAVSMKDGRVGVAYIGFTRDKVSGQSTQSAVFFTRYRDRNASDVDHDWEYEFTRMPALSQNLAQGQFLDKVSLEIAPNGTLYLGYTRFTGSSGSSNVFLAQSADGGRNWTSSSIDKDSKYGQATVIAVNPQDSSKVGVLWRTFVNSTLVFKSTAKGTKNVDLFAGDPDGPYRPYDQYPQSIVNSQTGLGDPNRVVFRALAFPAAAYTPDGTKLVVVFTEWINLGTGKPGTTGTPMPMIVMKVSTNNGASWSPRYVLNWGNGELGSVPASPQRLGFFSPARPVGAQLMPAIACGVGNQCLVAWKQSFASGLVPGGSENPGSFVASGFGRRFDVRGALVTFSSAPNVAPSFQVSRYGYKELAGTETPGDVNDGLEWAARMELPNGTTYPMFDWGNLNHTGGGRAAFAGDYIDVREVKAPGGTSTYMVAFSDNRFNIWPWQTETGGYVTPGQEWAYYPVFKAPNDPENKFPGLSCVNYGSRVQSVMAARVTPSALLITAPTNRKPFNGATPACGGAASTPCIEFPMSVRNNSGVERDVLLSLSGAGSFAKRPYDPALDGDQSYAYPLTGGPDVKVTIFPYSSYSLNLYAFNDNPLTVTATSGSDTATFTFNDPAVKAASDPSTSFTYVPSAINLESGSARSGSARSGSARSGSARSGSARSYPVPEDPVPGQEVYDVIDYTYVVTPTSDDDVGTYLSLLNIDPAYEGSYVFQVFVTKPLTSFMTELGNLCSAFNWTEGALVGHISDPDNPLVSGSARSGSARSGSARSGSARSAIPSEGDPLVQNTSFTLGSSTLSAGAGSFAASSQSATSGENCRIDECTLAAPRSPNEVTILVRAYQIKQVPDVLYDPDGSRTGNATPPSVVVAEYSCDDPSCTAALGPDLVVQNAPYVPPPEVPRVKAGRQVSFPTISIENQGVDGQCGTEASPKPCGDARAHQWAVYASTEGNFNKVPRVAGKVKLNSDPAQGVVTVLVTPLTTHLGPLGVGGTETAAVGNVTIPSSIPRPNNGTGTYFLHFYDDSERLVNELDETNNHWTKGPIIVEAPGYGFLGFQTPCNGPVNPSCEKPGAIVLAWQFTDGSGPVDSVATLPQLKFFTGCLVPPTGPPAASSSPNPTDITSGSSGWQYFPNTGMTRPQYTWQFNFDSTGLAPQQCYSMYIEVPGTGQVIGSTDPALQPFGPFPITPK